MISICLCIGYSLFGSSSLSTKGKRRFYICVLVQRKIAVWVAKKPNIIGLFAEDIFFVSTLWRRWFIRSARFRARRHAHGRRNSHRLFLCFATAFSNLSAYTIKNPVGKKPSGFLAQMVHSLGSLPRSPTRTRPAKQPPAVSLLRNRLFESLRLHNKKSRRQKAVGIFGADGEIRTLAAVTHPTPLAGAPRHQLEYICKTVNLNTHCQVVAPIRCLTNIPKRSKKVNTKFI